MSMAWQKDEKKRSIELEKAMKELKLDNSALQANKTSLEDELFTLEKNIVVMLAETFNQTNPTSI